MNFAALILIPHVLSQNSISLRWCCNFFEASRGSCSEANIAVSPATASVVVFGIVGKSDVYRVYSSSPRTLSRGTLD